MTGGITHGHLILEFDSEVLGVSDVLWRPSFATSSRTHRFESV